MRRRDVDLLGQGLLVLLLGDELLDPHAPEHVVLAGLGRLQPLLRIVLGRALRQPGQERRLRDREVLDVDVEEGARRRLDPVRTGAEVDLVQIEVEDIVLAELVLETQREDDLLQLALEPPLGREQQRLHDLLRDRAAALDDALVRHVHDEGARDAERIDAGMPVEVGVLGGEERLAHVGRHALQGDDVPPLDV
jgi:hypothetical protein